MLLKDKRVFVTGSSRGVGRAIALQAAKDGADVVVHYKASEEKALEVVSGIQNAGRRALAVRGDWSNPEDVRRASEKAWNAFGGLDVLVNNAGISVRKHVLDVTQSEFDALFATNVRGAFYASQIISKRMIASDVQGQIFTITSVNALLAGTGLSVYSGTKAALERIMSAMAMELSLHGIRSNTLALGATETDMNARLRENPALLEHVRSGIPLRRLASPEEIAEMVCMLLSDRARYMTGSTVVADGGLLLLKGYSPPEPYPGAPD